MGELPPTTEPNLSELTVPSPVKESSQVLSPSSSSPGLAIPGQNAPLSSQLSPDQAQWGQDPSRIQVAHSGGHRSNIPQAPEHEPSALNMAAMVGALPDHANDPNLRHLQPHHQQRQLSGASTSAVVYQLQQIPQLRSSANIPLQNHTPYNSGYGHMQYPPNFPPQHGLQYGAMPPLSANPQRPPAPNMLQYQHFQQPAPYVYYPQYSAHGPYAQPFPPQSPQSQPGFSRRPSLPASQGSIHPQTFDTPVQDGSYQQSHAFPGGLPMESGPNVNLMGTSPGTQGLNRPIPSGGGLSTIPRGPPRKPRQSGHALWVGNLPPGTTVLDLKDHFSRDATKDIESLFLISKSNCAFVNYRTEAACTAAMHRFHDSRFQGVRLVCRLRRSSVPASGVPTGPSAMVRRNSPAASPPQSPQAPQADGIVHEPSEHALSSGAPDGAHKPEANAKYFILKSLTLQDLELSVRNGIWTTQSHNEEILNKAFQTVEEVYLIFSANKSGEYFGYARMVSPIMDDAQQIMDPAPNPETLDSVDIPKSIPTPATEYAPKGRIIDDSARGTIFWEAEFSDSEGEDEGNNNDKEEARTQDPTDPTVAQNWGKPFKVQWISTNRVPFYRTRGLRNAWNANREVKIARDGTELETGTGARLIQMFHRLGPSEVGAPMMQQLPHHQSMHGQLQSSTGY